jgi:hypothetical protein
MRNYALLLLTAAIALTLSTAAFADQAKSQSSVYLGGYPERPSSARVIYELWYFPVRLVSMVSAVAWDVPTGAFQDGIKGSIGFTQTVARNLGKEDGVYEMIAGGIVGGPVGAAQGSAYGLLHGFGYGVYHGFVGYPSPYSGSHSMLFQGMQYRVPYDDNY